ncbi:hypothetical protein PRZ48_011577 [Zasmidium cellare]|uniref:Uncharacterized protein n=1 Tax=Zasmidium cellare TaxID=395010 RepID=A0ABR0E6R7_ZASCE|nr:hypothetical protein PRZ48_011577 [Zasmidium cellare]
MVSGKGSNSGASTQEAAIISYQHSKHLPNDSSSITQRLSTSNMSDTNHIFIFSASLLFLQTIYTLERPDVRSAWKGFRDTYWPTAKKQPEEVMDVYY